ncbi:hypothetical protein [Streptomyces omiyaensis]|uniref:Uncharacterized protein n=1 Tax=Streptomyces omiyaensis TaxID=68247 RepID=A0ABW7BXN6_9ACTN|nr:hypothetical protein [Streptomyces omiyaensis]
MTEGSGMDGGGEWWILVERTTYAHREWELVATLPVDGGRERAIERAAELARTGTHPSEERGRRVFRTSPTNWLVETGSASWDASAGASVTETSHERISVAELEYARETPAAGPPSRSRLRRALGGGA